MDGAARSLSLVFTLTRTVAAVLVIAERRRRLVGVVVDKFNQIAEISWTVLVKYTLHEGDYYEGGYIVDGQENS